MSTDPGTARGAHATTGAVARRARRRTLLRGLATVLAACCAAPTAHAQTWPARAITIVSPYPAGGITDILSRTVAEGLAKALGQSVVVENRVGAGGAIAMSTVARAAPDGYTLVMGGSAVSTVIPALNPAVSYHPLKDFEPVAYVAALPIVLVAHPSIPAKTLDEFVAYVRANADKLNCAHHGPGTGTHLACLQFARKLGVSVADVPYKGAPQVNLDLLANRVQFYFGTPSSPTARAPGSTGSESPPIRPTSARVAQSSYPVVALRRSRRSPAPTCFGTPDACSTNA